MNSGCFQDPKYKCLRQSLRTKATEPELILWERLRQKRLGGYKFTRQYGIGRYIVDFYCSQRRLIIELDGSQHAELEAMEYDAERTEFFKTFNMEVLRFWNYEVMNDLDVVCEEILNVLDVSPPQSPS